MLSNRKYADLFLSEEDKSVAAKKLFGAMYIDMMSVAETEKDKMSAIMEGIKKYNDIWNKVNSRVGKVLLKDGFAVAVLYKFPEIRSKMRDSGYFPVKIFRRKVASIPKITA